MLDDIRVFIHIAQQGGLGAAAQVLSLPPATVTRRLQRLEQHLNCKLVNRSARHCQLTQQGEVYYHAYVDLVAQFEHTEHRLNEANASLTGQLKVLAPMNFSHGFLKPFWLRFTRTYPQIALQLELSNDKQDMVNTQADMAIRIGPQHDSAFMQQRLGESDTLLVASPEFMQRQNCEEVNTLEQLRTLPLIGTTLRKSWQLTHLPAKRRHKFVPRFMHQFNDTSFVKYLACDGQGAALLPRFEIIDELQRNELKCIAPNWRSEPRTIYALWPSGRLLSRRAQLLKQQLNEFIATHLPSDNG